MNPTGMHRFSGQELRFLAASRVGRLATVGREQPPRPHCVPVCYALEEGRIWIPLDEKPKSGKKLRRLRNIESNPAVCLTVDRYEDDWSQLAYLLIEGTAAREPLTTGARAALVERYRQYESMKLQEAIVLTPLRAVFWSWQD